MPKVNKFYSSISIVIPAYNEEENIPLLFDAVQHEGVAVVVEVAEGGEEHGAVISFQ